MRPATPPFGREAAVYLLQRHDRLRFKLGWSLDPLHRARGLPEWDLRELDLAHSRALWLPSSRRARQVEKALHRSLAPYAVRPGHDADGHTEWFRTPALSIAIALLRHMPQAIGGLRPLEDSPTDGEVAAAVATPAPSILEGWYRIQDLWTRLGMELRLAVSVQDGTRRLRLRRFRSAWHEGFIALRGPAMSAATYELGTPEQRRPLVSLIDYDGDDLVLSLASNPRIERWPEGPVLRLELEAFLSKLQRLR